MPEKKLTDFRVAILATNGVEQSELIEPRKALQEAGAETVLVAPEAGAIQGFKHFDKADQFPVQQTLENVSAEQFDAVLLPGGALNADILRAHPRAQQFVQQMDKQGKPIAVICHGPWLLASAGLLHGRKITSYHTIQDDMRNAGAEWTDQEVVTHANWVSSRKPSDIPAFNRAMLELFGQHAQKRKAA